MGVTEQAPSSPHARRSETPSNMAAAVDALRAGLVVAIPTDTVYGLAVDPSAPGATDLLFAVKARPNSVETPILVSGEEQAEAVVAPGAWTARVRHLTRRWWPGPLTIVVERRGDLSWALGGDATTIGLRRA